jgi:hypothetical protein
VGQFGFFDLNRSYEGLDEKSDPLVVIAAMVPFEAASVTKFGRVSSEPEPL